MTRFAALTALFALGAADPVANTIEVQAGTPPFVATVGGERQFAYELHVTNLSRQPLILDRLAVTDPAGRQLATLDHAALAQAIDSPALVSTASDRTLLAPGARAILYLNMPTPARLPARLVHRFVVRGSDAALTVQAQDVAVRPVGPLTLGPPLGGEGLWAAVYAPDMNFGHRRYVYALGGVARIPGRFAIDWFRVEPNGSRRRAGGDPVLAVADATVATVRDDMPDPAVPGGPVTLGDATGNYVALALPGGRFAFYEHLKQGVRVRAGQRVRRGQVIGFVGATGQAGEPHLHFHVADANSPLGAEGIPYRLAGFTRTGRFADIAAFDRGDRFHPDAPASPDGLPPSNAVGRFR